MLLSTEGLDVTALSSPTVAYAALDHLRLQLIITDFHLGDMESGIDIVKKARKRFDSVIPAILVTGDTSPTIGRIDCENVRVMTKPLDAEELLEIIRQLITSSL